MRSESLLFYGLKSFTRFERRNNNSDIKKEALNFTSEPLFEFKNGAPTGTRTQDPMIKSHLLYQLSYGRIQNDRLYHFDFINMHPFSEKSSRILIFFMKKDASEFISTFGMIPGL